MRYYTPTSGGRGHVRAVPSWGELLVVLAVPVAAVAMWVALSAAPALVFGLAVGVCLRWLVSRGSRAVRHGLERYRPVDRLTAGRRTLGPTPGD